MNEADDVEEVENEAKNTLETFEDQTAQDLKKKMLYISNVET